jgi:hypothetical protein
VLAATPPEAPPPQTSMDTDVAPDGTVSVAPLPLSYVFVAPVKTDSICFQTPETFSQTSHCFQTPPTRSHVDLSFQVPETLR